MIERTSRIDNRGNGRRICSTSLRTWFVLACVFAGVGGLNVAMGETVLIRADSDSVGMGHSVTIEATVTLDNGDPGAGYKLLPYVNGRRWGSHETTNKGGSAEFLLPLPNPGPARIQILARAPSVGGVSQWIWTSLPPTDQQKVCLQKTFSIGDPVKRAALYVAVDDRCTVFLNGESMGTASGWTQTAVFKDLGAKLKQGGNVLSVEAENGTGPAGLLVRLEVETEGGKTVLHSDASWQGWAQPPEGWPNPAKAPGAPVVVVAPGGAALWTPMMNDWPEWIGMDNLTAGRLMPADEPRSNRLHIEVVRRAFPAREPSEQLVGVQWEPWFTPKNAYWQTAQAVPVVGFYDSYNRDVLRQHVLWFVDLGVDFIMPDWSNHIWEKQHWDERPDATNEIIHATALLLETLAAMRVDGIPVPKVVLMPGLSNGPPAAMAAVNEQLSWVYHAWVRNPRFEGLWQDFDGKPLIVILDTGQVALKDPAPIDDSHFTVRWMSTQLQLTHHEKDGYWTWMDGSLQPIVTMRDGKPEAVTPTPAYFADLGWTGSNARGRCGGTTYIESFKVAIEQRPRVVLLHQWNEFTGQAEGQGFGPNHDRYVDTYSVELSDDLEPVSLTAPGYRGDKGGWGFYYLNLTRALIDMYRGKAPHDTILAVGKSAAKSTLTARELEVEWSVVGASPKDYTLAVDGQELAKAVSGTDVIASEAKQSPMLHAKLSLKGVENGPHTLTLTANGAKTRYPLSYTQMDVPLENPIPVQVEIPFTLKPTG